MNIIGFAASNSSTSINKRLVTHTLDQMNGADTQILDLNDYEMPIYSMDRERESGVPQKAQEFKSLIKSADKIIISFAEHNGSYSTAFKNIMDWISRIEGKIWENKPFLIMATSPGGRGGKSVLDAALKSFGHMGAHVISSFSLPKFYDHFDDEKGILDPNLREEYMASLSAFIAHKPS